MNRNSNATKEIKYQLSKRLSFTTQGEFVNMNVGGLRVSRLNIIKIQAGDCYEKTI